jgi:uncharacterized Fe-S radical SAM superfamily protein PflX
MTACLQQQLKLKIHFHRTMTNRSSWCGFLCSVEHCLSLKQGFCVIPTQAGIHTETLDSRLRGNDDLKIKA